MKQRIKTPISYWGGKQMMADRIVPLIPDHKIFVEPFFGGGAIFWAKEKSDVEIINDLNGMVVNFYEQLKNNFDELRKMIRATPYSRMSYKRALVVYNNPYLFEPVVKAWAFWLATNQGFSHIVGSWRSSQKSHKESLLNNNKKESFTRELSDRLDFVQIECMDAVELITRMDGEDTFFYIDPPYVGADQGHYGGYLQEHFDCLLGAISGLKGRFILSCYPNNRLTKIAHKFAWKVDNISMPLSASMNAGKKKCEVLVRNF